jgi:RNA polymerase sigma-70 factor (ECF subfamily)
LEALSDNVLMMKVKEGDLDKMGLLFERYKRPLYGFFYGLTKQQELSEDLVQNTFLRILKYRHLFRGEPAGRTGGGDFRAWMFHIARNVNNDHHRKNKIKATEGLEHWQERIGHQENRAVEMQQIEEQQLLSMAMERLPEDKREVLLLSKFQEKKYSEIGEVLGCTEGAVKVKVFRALQELKAIYKQLESIH